MLARALALATCDCYGAATMSTEEQALLASLEQDSNRKARNIALIWTVVAALGALAMFGMLAWPQLQSSSNDVIQTRVTWLGSTTLGWLYVLGIPIGLALVAIRYGRLAMRHQQKLRA